MQKIAVITDTDASLPLDLALKHAITQVPIAVQFGEKSFRAVYDIDDAETFRRIDQDSRLPTTAAPSPGQFAEAYRAAFEAGAESVLCFTVSSEVSATHAAARDAAGMFPDRTIRVVDTRSLTMGQGWMVLAAAEAVADGATIEEAIATAQDVGSRAHLFTALATLKYLAMSGRVGQVAAGIANVLNVKPILTIRDGRLDLLEQVRTQTKAWDRAIEHTVEATGGKPVERMSIVHVNALEAANQFEARLRAALDCPAEIIHAELTPGLSVHSGNGMVGVVIVSGKYGGK
ncbi:MAG: DegV family protein [Anaerolineales bacterium]|jgi:DegV family protein with EDD domain